MVMCVLSRLASGAVCPKVEQLSSDCTDSKWSLIGTGMEAADIPLLNLGGGSSVEIGPSSNFINGFPVFVGAFPTNGNFGGMGLRFLRESDSMTLYGWVSIVRSTSMTSARRIVDYAYKDDSVGSCAGFARTAGVGRDGAVETTTQCSWR